MKPKVFLGQIIILLSLSHFSVAASVIGDEKYPKECLSGPTFWCSTINNAKACKAVNHCIRTVWSRTVVPDDNDDICHVCKDMIQKVRSMLLSNSTTQDLLLVFETSCKLIPVKLVKEECLKIVDQFIPDILEMMAARMNPLGVCSSIGLCNSKWVDQILAEYDEARKEEPTHQSTKYQCQYCKNAVDKVQSVSDVTVFGKLLELCARSGSFAATCVSLVNQNFDEQYNLYLDRLKGADVCSQLHFCSAFDKMKTSQVESSAVLFVPNEDIQCEFCENVVGHLREILVTNTTQAEFKVVLQSLCKQSGTFDKQCLDLVDQYYVSVYDFLLNGLVPKEACRLMTLCPNPGFLTNENQDVTVLEDSSEEDSDEVHGSTKKGNGNSQGIINGERKLFADHDFDSLSDSSNSSEEDSSENQDGEASDTEEKHWYAYEVTNGKAKHHDVSHHVDVVPLKKDDKNKNLARDLTMGEFLQTVKLVEDTSGEETSAKVSNTSFCLICEYAMNELDKRLTNTSTEIEIRQAVDNLCAYLPSTVAEMCISFIDKYGDDVYQMLLQKLVPKAICVQIGLCLSSGPSDSISIPYQEAEEVVTVHTCEMCQVIIDYIDQQLKDDTIEEGLDRLAERACDLVPAASRDTCKAIVDTYGSYLISQLGIVADKRKVCEMVHLCKSPPAEEKRQLLGGEMCTWGPSHWCSSVENAKSCNALEHCQKKVWLKAEP